MPVSIRYRCREGHEFHVGESAQEPTLSCPFCGGESIPSGRVRWSSRTGYEPVVVEDGGRA